MSSFNSATVLGRLGRDPELRKTPSGKSVCSFSIATDDGYGEKKETTWHNIVVWDKQGENAAKYLKKGSQVLVEGRLQYRKFTNKDGVERQTTEIIANKVQFVGGGARIEAEDVSQEPISEPDTLF